MVPGETKYDRDSWYQFLDDRKLRHQHLSNYYPVGQNDPVALTHEEGYKIVQEIFSDAVTTGTIKLANGTKVDDYELLLIPGSADDSFKRVDLRRRGRPEQEVILSAPGSWFTPLTEIGDWTVERILMGIVDAINTIS